MRLVLSILGLCLLTGCILPLPHTSERSPEIRGEVYDGRTHAPIQGAKIFFTNHPKLSCRSDTNGCFRINARFNWHLLYLIGAGNSADWPSGERWDDRVITVSHKGYVTRTNDLNLGNTIFLDNPGEASEQHHVWLTFNGSGVILQDMGAAQYLKPGDIRVAERLKNNVEDRPSRLHIGFEQQVFNPCVTAIDQPDKPAISAVRESRLVWGFGITYYNFTAGEYLEDSSRVYKLEFIP